MIKSNFDIFLSDIKGVVYTYRFPGQKSPQRWWLMIASSELLKQLRNCVNLHNVAMGGYKGRKINSTLSANYITWRLASMNWHSFISGHKLNDLQLIQTRTSRICFNYRGRPFFVLKLKPSILFIFQGETLARKSTSSCHCGATLTASFWIQRLRPFVMSTIRPSAFCKYQGKRARTLT